MEQKVTEILGMIREDVEAGLFPEGAVLDSFEALHDYVDANGYLIDAFPDEVAEYGDSNAAAGAVSEILGASPIVV